MKTIIVLLIGLALIAAGIFFFANSERTTSNAIVLVDETEMQKAKPSATEVLPIFGLAGNKWNGAEFSIEPMTDASFNRSSHVSLAEGGSVLLASTFTRDKEVSVFNSAVTAAIDSLADDTIGRPHSSVYIPMARALNTLAESTAENKFLIVYGDLRENRSSISFYDPRTLVLLRSDSSKIETQLLADAPLVDLTGITIYFIYEPENEESDVNFRLISGFYTHMFESRGAHVIISANLTL